MASISTKADFIFANHGSVTVLTPLTDEGWEWTAAHLPEDAQRWGGGIVIEPRYASAILDGIAGDGLTVDGA